MPEVTLPPPMGESLDAMLEVLDGRPPDEELRFAGGTALAAIWKHRLSTDIDLVCSEEAFRKAMAGNRRVELRDELRRQRSAGAAISAIKIGTRLVAWRTRGGPAYGWRPSKRSCTGSSSGD